MIRYLTETKKSKNLKLLIYKLADNEWLNYFEKHSNHLVEFITSICNKAAELFKTDPTIIVAMVKLLKNLDKNHLRADHSIIDSFLEKTNSFDIVTRLLMDDLLNESHWELSCMIREQSFDYLLFEWEEGHHPIQILRSWLGSLRYSRQV